MLANLVNDNDTIDITASDVMAGLHILKIVRTRNNLEMTQRLRTKHDNNCLARKKSSDAVNDYGHRNSVAILADEEAFDVISQGASMTSLERDHEREILSITHSKDINTINEGAHFMVYAQAAYTIVAFMLENPITGFASLLWQIIKNVFCCEHINVKDSIEGDNIYQSQYIAFKALSKLEDNDIIYANFIDNLVEIPYMIVLDHEWKSVVITIRGTITIESILTDINVTPKTLENLGEECGFDGEALYCHTGMLATTNWLYADLKKHGKLAQTLARYNDYKLRIVGHSLGAGVGSILSVLLRPKYPNLRCLAFSPPGCVMSENLADDISKYTTSYIVNDDIIARTSIEGFEELRDSILDMICRIKVPKHQVAKIAKQGDLTTTDGLNDAIDRILYKKEEIKESKFKHDIDQFLKFQKELKKKNRENYTKLCPPGKLVQLVLHTGSDSSNRSLNTSACISNYIARYAERSVFEKVNISSNLVSDHSTLGVKLKLERIAEEEFGLNSPFLPLSIVFEEDTSYNQT